MPGQGKFTVYAPPATSKNNLMDRLFKGNASISNPFAGLVGKENETREMIVALGKKFLTPDHQAGDLNMFPNGVNLDFSGDPNGITAPDQTKVVWKNPGDPANGFTPDISSPGPGKTEGVDKDVDPKISIEDVKGGGYIPGAPNTSTKSPAKTSPAVRGSVELGKPTEMGYDVHKTG